jgi:hypothetical protein
MWHPAPSTYATCQLSQVMLLLPTLVYMGCVPPTESPVLSPPLHRVPQWGEPISEEPDTNQAFSKERVHYAR